MPELFENPIDKLYTGALLGKALAEKVGRGGAEQASFSNAEREATVQAGVASGKISPSALGLSDANLLGKALSGKVNLPNTSNPLSVVGGFFENLGSDVGSFASGLAPAAFNIGKAALETIGQKATDPAGLNRKNPLMQHVVEPMVQQTVGELKPIAEGNFQPFYEHPLGPILDVGGIASLGLGSAIKGVNALSRAGKFGQAFSGVTPAGERASLAALAPVAKRINSIGATATRPPINISPYFPQEAKGLFPATVSPGWSPNIGMKYVVQKPMDYLIRKTRGHTIPGLNRSLEDIRAQYHANKITNVGRGRLSAGVAKNFGQNLAVENYLKSINEVYKAKGPGDLAMQYNAMLLHSMGVDNLDTLDNLGAHILADDGTGGLVLTQGDKAMANYLGNTLFPDPRFRKLFSEGATEDMKNMAFYHRLMNVDVATRMLKEGKLSPYTSEHSMFSRKALLENKTVDEVKSELPPELQPDNAFAKGLWDLQEAMQGKPDAVAPPSIPELASHMYSINGKQVGTLHSRIELLTRAIKSFEADQAENEPLWMRQQQPNYLPGNNLFEKVGIALHDEMGIAEHHAQSFVAGVPLGEKGGPIFPTYVPSVSVGQLKFGLPKERTITHVGRVLGVKKFNPISGIERQPHAYEFSREFLPRSMSARMMALPPQADYLREATHESWLKGATRYDPEAMVRNTYMVHRDLVTRMLSPRMIDTVALKGEEGKVRYVTGDAEAIDMGIDIGEGLHQYSVVPVDTVRNYIKAEGELALDIADLVKNRGADEEVLPDIQGMSDESVRRFVQEETSKATARYQANVILPNTFVKNLMDHKRVSETGGRVGRSLQFIQSRWKLAVLSLMPAWLLRTTVGHGILALISGVWNPKYWVQASNLVGHESPINPASLHALSPWNKAGDALLGKTYTHLQSKTYPEEIPWGINQGSMAHEVLDVGQGTREAKLGPVLGANTKLVHMSTNYQRRAIFYHRLEREANQRFAELGTDFAHPGGFWDSRNIDAVMDPAFRETVLKDPDLLERVQDQVSKVSYTFGQMSPWERRIVKYAMPFYGWYKFVSKFAWQMPFNYPGRTAMIAAIGRLGRQENEELGPMPSWLSGAIFYDHRNLAAAHYLNAYGLNPLEQVANPFGAGGPVEGLMNLSQFSPIIKAGASAIGLNPVTGGQAMFSPESGIEKDRWGNIINLVTGEEQANLGEHDPLQRFIGEFARAFPEIKALELLRTGGNPVYPESIPLIKEYPIPVNPETRRGSTLLSFLEQEFGVQPRVKDLTSYRELLQKSQEEALRSNERELAKAKEKLAAPNPK